jgi:isopentenyl diphosphate isomerase/L-lactate dehydrogenase-like FMN-dependent dehydrogenase
LMTELRTAMFVTGMGSVGELRERGKTLLHRLSGLPERGLK